MACTCSGGLPSGGGEENCANIRKDRGLFDGAARGSEYTCMHLALGDQRRGQGPTRIVSMMLHSMRVVQRTPEECTFSHPYTSNFRSKIGHSENRLANL